MTNLFELEDPAGPGGTVRMCSSFEPIVSLFPPLFISFSMGWYVTYPTTRPGVKLVFSLFSSDDLDPFGCDLVVGQLRHDAVLPVASLGRLQYGTLLPSRDDLTLTLSGLRFDSSSDAPTPPRMVCSSYPNGLTWCQSFHGCTKVRSPSILKFLLAFLRFSRNN